jgi:hypothetical protein
MIGGINLNVREKVKSGTVAIYLHDAPQTRRSGIMDASPVQCAAVFVSEPFDLVEPKLIDKDR